MTAKSVRQAFPNFYLAILGDFNGLESEKFGKRSASNRTAERTLVTFFSCSAMRKIIPEAKRLKKKLFAYFL